jgi:hypothetical protein
MEAIKNKLVDFFVSKEDAKVIKKDGDTVVILGHSLSIWKDPISGRTRDGVDVEVFASDIQDVVPA